MPFAKTLEVRDGCLCLHVQRAARVLARRFDDVLKPAGLTNGQFSLLMSLNRPEMTVSAIDGKSGSSCDQVQAVTGEEAPMRAAVAMRDVAALLGMDRTTLTAAVKTLERRGLLRVETPAEDRRGRSLRLTREGMRALVVALPIWTREHARLDEELGEEGPAQLRAQLRGFAVGKG